MPVRNSDKLDDKQDHSSPLIFVHAGKSGAPGKEWLETLGTMGMPLFSHGDYSACTKTKHGIAQLGLLLMELVQGGPAPPVLILSTDIEPDCDQLKALLSLSAMDESPVARSVLSNISPACNPFAGLSGNNVPEQLLTATVDLLGPGRIHGLFEWPEHLLSLGPAAVQALSQTGINSSNALSRLRDKGGNLLVSDRMFAYAKGQSLFNSRRLEPHESIHPPSWGDLSARIESWLNAACPDISSDMAKKKPATLHVTHSWGGGVALWTRTFIDSDKKSAHLQLRSEGPQSNHGAGQRLSLYSGVELNCPIASWWLQPPVQSLDRENEHYRQILDEICARHGIGRIIVSSLVGHSLDVMRTGIPTLQILHDHFPVWPFLSAHPLSCQNSNGEIDISTALESHEVKKEFPGRSAESWLSIRDEYLAALKQNDIKLAAPSPSVIELQNTLDPRWTDLDIALIPHGFPPLKAKLPVVAKSRKDDRLRLLVLGRIQAGKGLRLLLDALPRLNSLAQVYLVGTGECGEAFFGMPGVNVIIDYDRDKLPELLTDIGPDAAALVSLVPETFSYTLSELHYLGIPVIATKVGSFPGRIKHGENGWLIDPNPQALIDIVRQLYEHRASLDEVRQHIKKQEVSDTKSMVLAYRQLIQSTARKSMPGTRESSLAEIQASALAFRDIRARVALALAKAETGLLQKEVLKRTDWALDSQRELKEEQELRNKWVELLKAEIAELNDQTMQLAEELGIALADLSESRNILERRELRLKRLNQDLDQLQAIYDQVLGSSSWKITRPFRVLRRTGQNFMRSRAWNPLRWPLLISGVVRDLSTVGLHGTLMRLQFGGYEEPQVSPDIETVEAIGNPDPPESVPHARHPLVSIVIPAFNNWVYTAACLRSINDANDMQGIEVILVDDESSDETGEKAPDIEGLIYLRNSENAGFIESCNRGAAQAKGKYLVFLNNDTQVLGGWLDALLDVFNTIPDAGLVGSRLVYPEGSLQECGGLVFNDGSAWNYGKGDIPDRPEYMHVRNADYCSGASIMIETELFHQLGGFDQRYKPAYYEDTDLAFAVRAKGRRVLVQPASTVIHHEGITSGTDTDSGTKRYQVVNQETFANRWREELAAYPPRITDPTNPANIRAARDHQLRGRILIIDATTPEPDQDSGSLRLTQVMRCFMGLGFGVTFLAENHSHAGKYTRQLQGWGIEVIYQPWIESNQAFFRERGKEFDYVMVSRHYVASNYVATVRKFCPQARFIFDTVDLHYLREQRLAELEDSPALRQVASQTRRSELKVIEQSDAVLVVSETEIEVLRKDAPDALVHVLSNIHDVPGRQKGYEERKDLFFVGGYQHPPNVDAAKWFVTRIWPLIHAKLPGVKFHLIGSKAPDSIQELKGDGVIFQGFVEDLDKYLNNCRIAVAPLRYGAGVKGKVNMSMSHGQPVVATPMAVEGIHAEHGRDVLVADTENAFAEEVIRLYRDEDLWNSLSVAAIKNVESHFSMAAASANIESLLAKLDDPDQD